MTFHPKPNIHLSCLSTIINHNMFLSKHLMASHHKPQHTSIMAIISSKAANKSWQKHGNNVLIIKYIPNIQARNQASNNNIHNENVCSYQCMSYLAYLTASQHLQHQYMIILMHVHGIKARNKEKSLIQHVKDKQTTKWRNKDLESIKRNQTEAYAVKETKKQKQKT